LLLFFDLLFESGNALLEVVGGGLVLML